MSPDSRRIRLIPPRWLDRALALTGLLCVLLSSLVLIFANDGRQYALAALLALLAVTAFALAYVFQDPPRMPVSLDYPRFISELEKARQIVNHLVQFLEQEHRRVAEAERALQRLQHERELLEPVVIAQRQTVEAVLSAHATSLRGNAWKGHVVGFAIGVLASLLAGAILYNLP